MKKVKGIHILRVVLGILILVNMAVIFLFSSQNGERSGETSGKVTEAVVKVVVPDYTNQTKEEQNATIQKFHPPVRKFAHMAEFGCLGFLVFSFLLTWKGTLLPRYLLSLAVTFLYACTDELHQHFSNARGPRFSDVMIDLSGALITCSVLLLLCYLIKRKGKPSPMQITHYRLHASFPEVQQHIAVIADLHGERHETLLEQLRAEKPDLILIPGDLMEDVQLTQADSTGYALLGACAAMAPTFYSLGNHEIGCYHSGKPFYHPTPTPLSDAVRQRIAETGAVLLDNAYVQHGAFLICGLTSGINGKKTEPNQSLLREFAAQPGHHILLCHHPEYFVPFVEKTDIELTVCGHAHGGQWRIFGRGIYAPGQGLFPKYTAGVLQNRCVISRGLGNHTHIPRILNRRELVMIHYGADVPEEATEKKNKMKQK